MISRRQLVLLATGFELVPGFAHGCYGGDRRLGYSRCSSCLACRALKWWRRGGLGLPFYLVRGVGGWWASVGPPGGRRRRSQYFSSMLVSAGSGTSSFGLGLGFRPLLAGFGSRGGMLVLLLGFALIYLG